MPEVVTASIVLTVMLRLPMAVWPAESVTVTVKLNVPAVVGLPEIVPEVLNASPGGRLPVVTVQVYGADPPVALSVVEG